MNGLSFAALRSANVRRCEQVFHGVNEWSPTDWGNAMAGEVGEACNLIKKLRRLGPTPETIPAVESQAGQACLAEFRKDIGKELADVVTYADLLAERLGIDLGLAVAEKFNEVSRKKGSDIELPTTGRELNAALVVETWIDRHVVRNERLSDDQVTLIAGNIRGFWASVVQSERAAT